MLKYWNAISNKTKTFTLMGVALSSALIFGQTDRPFDVIEVRFCPQSANNIINSKNFKSFEESQAELDKKYCKRPVRMLKETWDKMQFDNTNPIPETSVRLRTIPRQPVNVLYFFIAPVAASIACFAWLKHAEELENQYNTLLKNFKIAVKTDGIDYLGEIDFRKNVIDTKWNNAKVQNGFISTEALRDRLGKHKEQTDKMHDLTIAQLNEAISDSEKKISANKKDMIKTDKEQERLLKKSDKNSDESQQDELVKSFIEALKNHENGWLWKIIDNQTPLWLVGKQGCGKTWTSCAFALVRKYCLDMPVDFLIDEHYESDNYELWQYLEPERVAKDAIEITNVALDIDKYWTRRMSKKTEDGTPIDVKPSQIVVDEFTLLMSDLGQPIEDFYKRHLKDTRKAKSYFIGVTHMDTNASYPKGTKVLRDSGTILIEKFTADGKKPLSRAVVRRGLLNENGTQIVDHEGTFPKWFNPKDIHNHFNGQPIEF